MLPTPSRQSIIHGVLVAFSVALVVRAAQVQLFEHDAWARRATNQHTAEASLPAPRGEIEDATGVSLARSRELVKLSFKLDDMKDRKGLYRTLLKLGRAGEPREARCSTRSASGTTCASDSSRRRWPT